MALEKIYKNNAWNDVGVGTFNEQKNTTERVLGGSWQILYEVTLTPGVYELQGQLTIDPANTVGQDYYSLHIADKSEATYDSFYIGRQATYVKNTTGQYGCNCHAIVKVTSTRTFALVAWLPVSNKWKHVGSKFAYVKLK